MLIMTFLIAQGQTSCFEIQFIISVNINEAKLCFDLGGFEPRTYGSAIQHPNH